VSPLEHGGVSQRSDDPQHVNPDDEVIPETTTAGVENIF